MGGGGVGVGQDGGCDAPCTCTWTCWEELLLQPLLPRNQHPSPTTSFTNITQTQVLLLARYVQLVHASPR